MIELSLEQAKLLDGEEPARVVDPRTRQTYVLLREEDYRRMQATGADEELPDVAALLNEVMAEDDANDPYLESYQHYRK